MKPRTNEKRRMDVRRKLQSQLGELLRILHTIGVQDDKEWIEEWSDGALDSVAPVIWIRRGRLIIELQDRNDGRTEPHLVDHDLQEEFDDFLRVLSEPDWWENAASERERWINACREFLKRNLAALETIDRQRHNATQ